ncbi:hypothetical protein TcasGA2_TC002891 [Tribolium castaneum]|uniref:Uncharacterized protein n=1 Tax=Tribolium castaneum TaxID=7070 RepID=D6WHJ3_TRICA|nr:hypothetical protein TcasGA2_TC002891 [Tribolium castaneum]
MSGIFQACVIDIHVSCGIRVKNLQRLLCSPSIQYVFSIYYVWSAIMLHEMTNGRKNSGILDSLTELRQIGTQEMRPPSLRCVPER